VATISAPLDVATASQRAALPFPRVAKDIGLVAGRNLRKTIRNTGLIVFSTLQPLMQLVLFVEVFGSVIGAQTIGVPYKDYVVPAVLVQTMTFSSMGSGVGIANDLQTGMIDRFRSLPIARSAFLVGRTLSDSLRLGIQALLLVAMSFILGFRFHDGAPSAVAMIVVIVLFGLALATFSAWVGLRLGDPETVQAAVFVPLLPLVFTSSAFAPISSLPGWMQPIARANPITAAIDFARGLALGDHTLYKVNGIHLSTAAWHFALWWLGIVITFTTLAVRRYRKG
jgi:ABC-2 type transport system permease protein/oleandomycin transport system permease protein